ncbi:hypothetical protein [Xylanimonas oleitrophica]|uniref:hypothetical protein n=1 Tax=Xylanimonas oleitrophica TaxID=2607479 RepID=UPI0015D0A46E|nr:hypothetical protein [Xylanimonas oleitrophica]
MSTDGPTSFQTAILAGLSNKSSREIYQGTVPAHAKARRRAANKAARRARAVNRGR